MIYPPANGCLSTGPGTQQLYWSRPMLYRTIEPNHYWRLKNNQYTAWISTRHKKLTFVDLVLLNTFQKRSVSSPAPVTIDSPSGDIAWADQPSLACIRCMTRTTARLYSLVNWICPEYHDLEHQQAVTLLCRGQIRSIFSIVEHHGYKLV